MALKKPSQFKTLLAYAAAVGCMLSGVVGSAAVQALRGAIHDFELSAARGLLQGPLYIAVGSLVGVDFTIQRKHIPPLVYLGLIYVLLNIGSYGSTIYLPLAEVMGMVSIFSMIAAMIQAKVLFKKDIPIFYILSAIVCVFGILMIVQPQFQLQNVIGSDLNLSQSQSVRNLSSNLSDYKHTDNTRMVDVKGKLLGYFLCAIGGIAFGISLDVNAILLSDLCPFVKITYFTIIYFIASILISFYTEPFVIFMTFHQFLLLMVHAIGAAMTCFLNVYAAHIIGGVRVSLIFSLRILIHLLVQYTVMKSVLPGHRNLIEVVGALVLVFGAAMSSVVDIVQERRQANILP